MQEPEQPHVKVNMNMLYKSQLETQALVRSIELKLARTEWIERVAYAALLAGVAALVGMVIGAGR